MMEVNRSTTLEFGDLMTNTSNSNNRITTEDNEDIVDDVEMVSTFKTSLIKEDNRKENEPITNGQDTQKSITTATNDANLDPATIDLGVSDLDMESAHIPPELEDKLLADDDSDVVDKLLAEVVPTTILNKTPNVDNLKDTNSVEPNIQTDNGETLRNPGDDLDTLLSKINDIVDDCNEPEKNTTEEADLINFDSPAKNITTNEEEKNDLDESVILLDDSFAEDLDNDDHDDNKVEQEACDSVADNAETTSSKNQEDKEESKVLNVDTEIKTAIQKDLDEPKSSIPNDDETTTPNEIISEEQNETEVDEDGDCSMKEATKDTTCDRIILDDDSEVLNSKCPEHNDVSSNETKDIEANRVVVENTDEKEDKTDVENNDKLQEKKDETPSINKNEDIKQSEPDAGQKTDNTEKIAAVISLDADDSDDDVVFFCSSDANEPKELESEKTNQDEKKTSDEEKVKEDVAKEVIAANHINNEDDDDVVLLDDDDEDESPTKPVNDSNIAETDVISKSEAETEKNSEKLETSKIDSGANIQEETLVTKQLISKEDPSNEDKEKMLLDADSDNAKDKFDAILIDKILGTESVAGADAEETNSNCSSSSNLLQEGKPVSEECEEETDQGNEDEDAAENESETAGTEVDIAEAEIAEDDSKEAAPPAKRMRMSTDDEGESNNKTLLEPEVAVKNKDDLTKEITENENKSDVKVDKPELKTDENSMNLDKDTATLKRSIDSTEPDENVDLESVTKKIKTNEVREEEALKQKVATEEENKVDVIEIPDGKDDEDVNSSKDTEEATETNSLIEEKREVLPTVKAVPSHTPIPLYPPPQFQETSVDLNLDFLKRFKKSLDQMTKIDLEELVLQKIVEAIIHKSEFGEMRELLEKQEKIIAIHRSKITELSKQFRDLEMVHNRVLKDIEVKNSQFLMPVKITRAVGLQVFIPHKKNMEPLPNTTTGPSASTTNLQQSPQNQYRAPTNPGSQLTSPSRQNSSDMSSNLGSSSRLTNTVLASGAAAAAAAAAANARRGCVQKVTPQRPVEPSTSQQTSATYRPTQTQQALQQQNPTKLLNKSASTTPAQMRNRYSGPLSVQQQQQQQQQQLARQQPSPTNQLRKVSPTPSAIIAKQHNPSATSQQYRRPDTIAQTLNSPAPVPESYMSSIHQLPPGMPSVSITPAKPKEKSVIDLTDEDDAAPTSTAIATTSTAVRRVPSGPNSTNVGSSNYLLNKVPTNQARMPPNQNNKAQTTARQQLASIMYGSKTNGNPSTSTNLPSVSTPSGTSITRVQLAARKPPYNSHPAPLPPTPAQNLNPAWKLPPPRPTIRISNLDNGIVISWTVEESMDRHADCVSYQIYAYQETSGPPLIDSWRHVGDVKAMLLPMAVTLTQFQEGQRYYFAVRAVDVHHRVGPFSLPKTWS